MPSLYVCVSFLLVLLQVYNCNSTG